MNTINIQPIEKLVHDSGSSLDVHSIFYTIQGEGPFCGTPAVFIRLAGCNLQCPGCDTEYTNRRHIMHVRDMAVEVRGLFFDECEIPLHHGVGLIVITGGEPFRQNITKLCDELLHEGYRVQVETNGTLPPSKLLDPRVVIVCSPKTGKVNPQIANLAKAYKYVMHADSADDDGLPILALDHTAAPRVARPPPGFKGEVYLQPMDTGDEYQNKGNLMSVVQSCMRFGYRLQLQIHKIIGVA